MEWIELSDICNIKSGGTPSRSKLNYWSNGTIPWVKISDIKNKYIDNTEELITEEGLEGSSAKIIKRGSILYTIFATVGKAGILDVDAATNQAIVGLEILDDNQIVKEYLYYYLTSIENYVKSISRGVAQNNINVKILKKLQIPIPPIENQKQIVRVLDEAQSLIDNRKKQIELLDDLIESVFYEMFGDPVKNEKGWNIKTLGECTIINPKKSEITKEKKENMKVSFIPMQNVLEDGTLLPCETKDILDVYKGYTYLKENDVLFAKITPCMENGKGCIAKNLVNKIGFASTEFHVIRVKEYLTKEYIYALTKGVLFRKHAASKMTGSGGQKRVPKDFLENYKVILPPLSLQNEFAEKVEAIEEQKKLLEKSLKLMEDNYNSLMQKAFKGELF